MKIVYLFHIYANKAGTERVLIDKMNWLSEHGFNVIALSYEQGDHPYSFPISPKVQCVDLNVRFFSLYRFSTPKRLLMEWVQRRRLSHRMRDFLQQHRPDIVICTTYNSFEIEILSNLCPNLNIHFWIEAHCTFLESFRTDMLYKLTHLKRPFSQSMLSKVSGVVALTEGDAKEWRKVVDRVEIIPNMVDLNRTGKSADILCQHVIYVGRFSDQKGLPDLLRIWRLVHARYPDWLLDMYGAGLMKESFIHEIEGQDLGILIHEPDANIVERYLESSIHLLPSVYEPFGLVIVEAMSCGLPVVSFDCPYGPASIITDGVDGFLISNRDVEAFAERVCQLIDDKDLRYRMGVAALQSSQRFSTERIMPMWKELFDSLKK